MIFLFLKKMSSKQDSLNASTHPQSQLEATLSASCQRSSLDFTKKLIFEYTLEKLSFQGREVNVRLWIEKNKSRYQFKTTFVYARTQETILPRVRHDYIADISGVDFSLRGLESYVASHEHSVKFSSNYQDMKEELNRITAKQRSGKQSMGSLDISRMRELSKRIESLYVEEILPQVIDRWVPYMKSHLSLFITRDGPGTLENYLVLQSIPATSLGRAGSTTKVI